MVLPPSLVSKENSAHLSTAGFIDVLDFLTSSAGFRVCGLKMVHLTLLTAGALHAICGDYNDQTQVCVCVGGGGGVCVKTHLYRGR